MDELVVRMLELFGDNTSYITKGINKKVILEKDYDRLIKDIHEYVDKYYVKKIDANLFAEFCILCEREGIKPVTMNDFIKYLSNN